MPRASDPIKVKKPKKGSVGSAISSAGKKVGPAPFSKPPTQPKNAARAKEQRQLRREANAVKKTKLMSPGGLRRVGGEVGPQNQPYRPFRLVDPITPKATREFAKAEVKTLTRLQKRGDKALGTLNEKGSGKLKKRDTAVETLRQQGRLGGESNLGKRIIEQERKALEADRKKRNRDALDERPVGQREWKRGDGLKREGGLERPSMKTVKDIAEGKATAQPAEALKKGIDAVSRAVDKVHLPRAKTKIGPATIAIGAPRPGVSKTMKDLGVNAAKDVVDLTANAIPSVYVPSREIAHGRFGEAAKMVAEGAKEAVTHPKEHPLAAALTVSGAYGALGRGVGKTARVVTSGKVGSIHGRAPATLPGTALESPRYYSKNIITKQAQKATDKHRKPPTMTPHEVQRRVDYAMSRNEGVRRVNRTKVVGEAEVAMGKKTRRQRIRARVENRGKAAPKPTAATQLASQRIVTGEGAHLLDELKHYRAQVASALVEGSSRERTRQATLAQLDRAIKHFDAEDVAKHADMYAALSRKLQDQLVELKLLDPEQARRASVIPYAVQKMGARHADEWYRDRAGGAELTRREVNSLRNNLSPREFRERVEKVSARLVRSDGSPLSTAAVLEHMRSNGVKPPAFITQAPDTRGARNYYVAQHQGQVVRGQTRTGEATRSGTFDVHPDTMIEAAARAQGLADAARGWSRIIGEFGYRENGRVSGERTYRQAKELSMELRDSGRGDFVPVKVGPLHIKQGELEGYFQRADATVNRDAASRMADATSTFDGADPLDTTGKWVLVDRAAAQRINQHVKMIGRGGLDPLGTAYGSLFRGVVLSTSPKWFAGNVIEAGGRTALMHAGPRSYVTMKKIMAELDRRDPEYAALIREEVLGGGHYAMSQRLNVHVGAESFTAGSRLQKMAQVGGAMNRTRPIKWIPEAWRAYTNFVFNTVNRGIERQFQTAMAGKAARDILMSDRLMKLSQEAIDEAVANIGDLNKAVALGKEVDRAYGRYSKMSPRERWWIATYTPFIRWMLNATQFLLDVLPRDHPVATAVLASSYTATEEWRKDEGLSMFVDEHLPGFLQGSIPGANGSHLRISRYTPFGAAGSEGWLAGTAVNNLLPQFMGIYEPLAKGQDWKGKKLNNDGVEARLAEAGKQFLGGVIPFFSPFTNAAGNEGTTAQKIRKQVDPFMFTQPKASQLPPSRTTGVRLKGSGVVLKPTKLKVKPIKLNGGK